MMFTRLNACGRANDAQILTMGARVVGPELAKSIVTAWVNSEFDPVRSSRKVTRMRDFRDWSANTQRRPSGDHE